MVDFGGLWRAGPNGKAAVLKTAGYSPLGVRIPRPPLPEWINIFSDQEQVLAVCSLRNNTR